MVAASEREAALARSHEAQAARIAALEARCASLEREHAEAMAASVKDRVVAEEAAALQGLLARRLRGVVGELAVFVNPYDDEQQSVAKADGGREGEGEDAMGRYRVAVEAAEVQLAAAAR